MNEFLRNYQNNCLLEGKLRIVTLQKVIAASVAYSAPCIIGHECDTNAYYAELCRELAYKIVSKANETILLNTDDVMADIELLWRARYNALNSPHKCNGTQSFHDSMSTVGSDVATHYEYWIDSGIKAAASYVIELNGGE